MQPGLLDELPLWGLYVATVLIVLLAVEIGFRQGRNSIKGAKQESDASVGAMVGAILGLLAFLLAFTFGSAASRFDARRSFVVDEANAVGTSYLRAGLLPEPQRTAIRDLLRAYVDARLQIVQPGQAEQAIHRSEELQDRLWSHGADVLEKTPGSVAAKLFIESLNEVIDIHTKRVNLGFGSRVPGSIWAVLYLVSILAMAAVGYHTGLGGTRRSFASLALVFAFSAVMLLIADLDRPQEGLLKVSQQAMVDLRNSLTRSSRFPVSTRTPAPSACGKNPGANPLAAT